MGISSLSNCARLLAALSAVCAVHGPSEALAVEAFRASSSVRVNGGHLQRDGQRLRQWGVNLQSGAFTTYDEINSLLDRLVAMGFNAIRLWPTSGTFYRVIPGAASFNTSEAGDGSDLDRFDYLVGMASQKGINIQMTMLHYLDLPMLRASTEPGIKEVVGGTTDDAMLRRAHGFAPYVSREYRESLKAHMTRVLTRRNPYTGRRYVDEPAVSGWELANEAAFLGCAVEPRCLQEIPTALVAHLEDAWMVSPHNPRRLALPPRSRSPVAPEVASHYRRFVADQFVAVSEDLRSHARRVGGRASGIASQPFIFNTDPGERSALSHYAYSAGDVFAVSAYSSPLTSGNGYHGTQWLPYVAGGPQIPFLSYVKVKDKPLIVYEASFFRPYPFRAEWGIVLAAIAIRQDWDGAFLYSYGHPPLIYQRRAGQSVYGHLALPDPTPGDKGERGHYAFGFHHGGDPVTMASWSVAGRLFLGSSPASRAPDVVWDIPLVSVFHSASGYPEAFLSRANLVELPREHSVALRFTDGFPACAPCVSKGASRSQDVVTWDDRANRLTVETDGGKAVAGWLADDFGLLAEGMALRVAQPGFGVIAVTHDRRRGIERVQLIGNAENSGAEFDRSRVDFRSPAGAFHGVVQRGRAPLVYSGPEVDLLCDRSVLSITEVDFSLNHTRARLTRDRHRMSARLPVFQTEVDCNQSTTCESADESPDCP